MIVDGPTAKVNRLGSRRESQTAAVRVARSQSSLLHDGVQPGVQRAQSCRIVIKKPAKNID
jgi:hypothetical protein